MPKIDLTQLAKSEAAKEFLRLILIAVIPVVIDSLQKGNLELRTIIVVAVVAGLRAIDRYLYKAEVDNPVTNLLKLE